MTFGLRRTGTGLSLGLLLGASACTLALGLDETQSCNADADCVYSNGQGQCVDNVCQAPNGGDDGSTTAPSGTDPTTGPTTDPTTDPSTTDPTTATDTATDTDPTACTVNTDCATDQRCSEDECVSLLSAECQILQYPSENFDRNNVVFMGSIMPTGGAFTSLVQPLENSTQLAIEDFNSETSLQGDRKIAWVGCDSTAGPASAVVAAQHLVDNVGAPAIVGPVFSESTFDVASQVTVDAGVFLITPSATAVSISEIEDNDLVWRAIAPDTYQINGIIDRAADLRALEQEFRLERLLVLAKGDLYGSGLLAGVQDELATALPGVEIFALTYENPANFSSQEELLSAYGATLATAFGELPASYSERQDHYTDVLILGTSEAQALVYSYLGIWATYQVAKPDPSPPMPRFTFSHGIISEMERIVDEVGVLPGTEGLVPLKPTINASLEGISPIVFNQGNFNAFSIRYRIRFNKQDVLSTAGLSYDSAMAVMFAMTTVPESEEITGAAVASAFPSLADPGGTVISFSGSTLSFISEARNALVVDGGTVDLQGVSGELTWDEGGDIRTGLFGWGLIDNDGGAAVEPRLTAERTYTLNKAPATDGAWVDIP